MGSQPMYFPPGFVMADAKTCAAFICCAYDQYAQWLKQGRPSAADFKWSPSLDPTTNVYSKPLYWTYYEWDWDKYITRQEPIGFVAVQPNFDALLVFRGTESDEDWYKDSLFDQTQYTLNTANYGNVHYGFYSIYTQLSPLIRVALLALNKSSPFKRFLFAGHSLGSALSSLAVPDVLTTAIQPSAIPMVHYNFASPRVGDLTYATAMNGNGVPTFRVVNTEDIVPDAPLAVSGLSTFYQHIGTEVDFTANYLSIGDNHSMIVSYKYAIDHPDHPFGPPPQRPAGRINGDPDLEFLHRDPRAAAPAVAMPAGS